MRRGAEYMRWGEDANRRVMLRRDGSAELYRLDMVMGIMCSWVYWVGGDDGGGDDERWLVHGET